MTRSALPSQTIHLILASRSPRRAQLLKDAGFDFEQVQPAFEDPLEPQLERGTPQQLAIRLAQSKAASLLSADVRSFDQYRVVLSADTIAVDADGSLIGTPRNHAEACAMLKRFVGSQHEVISGVAVMSDNRQSTSFADTAIVKMGHISDADIDSYLDTGEWQDKAGGYNLFDRQQAGWPITTEGDPTTVVGLPMTRLLKTLEAFDIHPRENKTT